MEWTKQVLVPFEEPLQQAGISGVIQFPYHFNTNVWMAFCELGGPLTTTLYYGADEVGISLNDWERIIGLPILRPPYDKFLPLNKDLVYHNKYPTMVIELLCAHDELYKFYKVKHTYYHLWLDHFYSEYLVYFAYGEQTNSEK